ncbi:hypothetical protein GQ53DRAFT_834305 [Thozetella sp. PMI_491]|nr:hypothetical protein GQ53DRAFT_834305 [Thozetella sp. PMI_491]
MPARDYIQQNIIADTPSPGSSSEYGSEQRPTKAIRQSVEQASPMSSRRSNFQSGYSQPLPYEPSADDLLTARAFLANSLSSSLDSNLANPPLASALIDSMTAATMPATSRLSSVNPGSQQSLPIRNSPQPVVNYQQYRNPNPPFRNPAAARQQAPPLPPDPTDPSAIAIGIPGSAPRVRLCSPFHAVYQLHCTARVDPHRPNTYRVYM